MKRFVSISLIIIMVMAVSFLGAISANASIATIHFEPSGNHNFGTVTIPYDAPEAYIVTATSTLGGVLTASLSDDSFMLSTELLDVPAIMTAIELTIIPKSSLVAGTHTATVTVVAADGTNGDVWATESFDISFTVKSDFGTVPNTGVPGIMGAIMTILTLFAIPAALWGGLMIRRRLTGS